MTNLIGITNYRNRLTKQKAISGATSWRFFPSFHYQSHSYWQQLLESGTLSHSIKSNLNRSSFISFNHSAKLGPFQYLPDVNRCQSSYSSFQSITYSMFAVVICSRSNRFDSLLFLLLFSLSKWIHDLSKHWIEQWIPALVTQKKRSVTFSVCLENVSDINSIQI